MLSEKSPGAEARTEVGRGSPRTEPLGRCPLCDGRDASLLFRIPDRLHRVPGRFTYRRCSSCRTVFQDPRVIQDDLSLCYPPDYYTHRPPEGPDPRRPFARLRDSVGSAVVAAVRGERRSGWAGWVGGVLAWSRAMRRMALHYDLVDELNPRVGGRTRVLDIGCGAGGAMTALARVGCQVAGVEWDPEAAEVARAHSGRPVWVGDFRRLELPAAPFDLALLEHVLEHLEDPKAALRRLGELLAPGGRALLIWPNVESFGARRFGEFWYHWDSPRHLVLPPARAVADHARETGWTPVSLRTASRNGARSYAISRAYRKGRPVEEARHGTGDRLAAVSVRALGRLGLDLGEECVLLLEKGASTACRG